MTYKEVNCYGGRYNRDRCLFLCCHIPSLRAFNQIQRRVTQTDITLASTLMDRMNLHGAARQAAQQAFREGKEVDFPSRATLQRVRQICAGRRDLPPDVSGNSITSRIC